MHTHTNTESDLPCKPESDAVPTRKCTVNIPAESKMSASTMPVAIAVSVQRRLDMHGSIHRDKNFLIEG